MCTCLLLAVAYVHLLSAPTLSALVFYWLLSKCTCLPLAVAYVHLLSALGPLYKEHDLAPTSFCSFVFLLSGEMSAHPQPKEYRWIWVEVCTTDLTVPGEIVKIGSHWFRSKQDAAWHGMEWYKSNHPLDVNGSWCWCMIVQKRTTDQN